MQMVSNYEKWNKEYKQQNFGCFNNDKNGLLWLKVRAISRSRQLKAFVKENGLVLKSANVSGQSVELFNLLEGRADAMDLLNKFLRNESNEWYVGSGVNIPRLKEDLYRVEHYSWGGDHHNSLDKYLVSHYVKVISDYRELKSREMEIGANAWRYVQNSWYNNWTSFIIESLFKRNSRVVPAVGEIKGIDFFIEGYPVDLKVTFFPNQYLENKFKAATGMSTAVWLKYKSRQEGILCSGQLSSHDQCLVLIEKLKELDKDWILDEFNCIRKRILSDAMANPKELMKWLYENQGELRFGAENRIYLMLVDTKDLASSWKLKRAFSLIEPKIMKYLEDFNGKSLESVVFKFKDREYTALSDILFVVK